MVGWYYVDGTERVGPIDENKLRELFFKEDISLETYVWKKGFANWEKLKNVEELKNKFLDNTSTEREVTEVAEVVEEKTVVEEEGYDVNELDWETLDYSEERFFICTGTDRNQLVKNFFGPYSLIELREAFNKKRINSKTYITTLGLNEWVSLGSIPLFTPFFGKDREFSLPHNILKPLFILTERNGEIKYYFFTVGDHHRIYLNGKSMPKEDEKISGDLQLGLNSLNTKVELVVIDVDAKNQRFQAKIILNSDVVLKNLNAHE